MHVRRPRRARSRVPAGTVAIEDGRGKVFDCIPWPDANRPTVEHALAAELLYRAVIRPILESSRRGGLVEQTTLQALENAYSQCFGCAPKTAAWLGLFLRELEFARRDWLALRLSGADPGPEQHVGLARTVLDRTRDALGGAGLGGELPSWLSPNLTALLLQKVSFGRGGGPQRALSRNGMAGLLSSPSNVARFLRANPRRASRFSVELAELERQADPTR
jgi:hypothetical protein